MLPRFRKCEYQEGAKDPLNFIPSRLASHIKEWGLDAHNAKQVKQRDKEEIDFLERMVKCENHLLSALIPGILIVLVSFVNRLKSKNIAIVCLGLILVSF